MLKCVVFVSCGPVDRLNHDLRNLPAWMTWDYVCMCECVCVCICVCVCVCAHVK